MKFRNIFAAIAVTLLAVLSNSCKEDAELSIDMKPVETLLSPDNNTSIALQSTAGSSEFFEWSEVELPDASFVMYEVVFDTPDGDFSNPVFRVLSDNNGLKPYVSISHKQLNKAGAASGINAAETGTLKWTVVASKGICEKYCAETRTIEITRLAGFADIPAKVFIKGDATEYQGERALKNLQEEGEFEIFTRLEADKTFNFTDGNGRTFYPAGGSLKEGEETTAVEKTGIYKISLDFNSGMTTLALIKSVRFNHCNSNSSVLELPYAGDGVWTLKKHEMVADDFTGDSHEEKNPRYRFYMEYEDGSKSVMGPLNFNEDSAPGDSPAASYFYAAEYKTGYEQFKPKWKRNQKNTVSWVGFVYDISLILNADSQYTHELVETTAEEENPPVEETGEMYLTGEGTEGGAPLSSALKMTSTGEKTFEIFTRLEGGKDFSLAAANSGTPAIFSISDSKIADGGSSKVDETGVYKISVNMENKTAEVKKILAVKWYHCNSAMANVEIPYAGKGVWELKGYTFTDEDVPGGEKPDADKKNPRYRFHIEYEDGVTNILGPVDIMQDAAPSDDSPLSYFYCKEYTEDDVVKAYGDESKLQYNPKWKRAGGQKTWVGDNYDIQIELTSDNYTHKMTKN